MMRAKGFGQFDPVGPYGSFQGAPAYKPPVATPAPTSNGQVGDAPVARGTGPDAPKPALPWWLAEQARHRKEGIDSDLTDTLGDLGQSQNEALTSYGYAGSFDTEGNLTGLAFDPKNPFSRAALLKRSFDQGQAGTTTSMAASGQLYSGALQNARDANTFDFQQGQDSLQGELTGFLREIIRRRRKAKTGANTAKTDVDDWAIGEAVGGGG